MLMNVLEFIFTHKPVMAAILVLAFAGIGLSLIRAIIGAQKSSKQDLERIRSICRRIVPHAWR